MVKQYSLKKDGDTQLSAHFQVKEFACHDGSDKILIDTELIEKLELLIERANASSIRVYSGYRSPDYEAKAGRSRTGSHTTGCSVDMLAKYKNGDLISAKLLCCLAQDIGFNGIGYMNKNNLHLDTKSRHWWGDETVKNGTKKSIPGNDFYRYFGIPRPSAKKYIQLKSAVWCRKGIGFRSKKYKVIPKGTKCELLARNAGNSNGYKWDKIIYNNETVYLPNNWNLYI